MANAINNSGSVVGFSSSKPPDFTLDLAALLYPPASNYHAFLYSGGKMYNLNNQLVNGAGWQLSFATGINNAGQIVGYAASSKAPRRGNRAASLSTDSRTRGEHQDYRRRRFQHPGGDQHFAQWSVHDFWK